MTRQLKKENRFDSSLSADFLALTRWSSAFKALALLHFPHIVTMTAYKMAAATGTSQLKVAKWNFSKRF